MKLNIKDSLIILKDNWALITGAFLLANIISISIYYGNYGLNVMPYLDISELITTWFVQITASVIIFFVAAFFLRYLLIEVDDYPFQINWNLITVRIVYLVGCYKFFYRYVKNGSGLPSEQFKFISHSFSTHLILSLTMFSLIVVLPYLLTGLISIYKYIKNREVAKQSYIDIIAIGIVVLFAILTLPSLEFQASDLNSTTILKLYTKRDTVTTSANYKYIGRSKNYIFFFDKKKGMADAYSLSEMIKITQQ